MYRRNYELAEINKTLSLLRQIDTLVLESRDSFTDLCQQLAASIAKATEFPFVSILVRPNHQSTELKVYGWSAGGELANNNLDLLNHVRINTHLGWLDSEDRSVSISVGSVSHHDFVEYLSLTPKETEELKSTLTLSSVHVLKLAARQELVGLMVVGLTNPTQQLTTSDQQLLERLSEAVGVAVDNKLLFEENQRVVKQLQKTNEKLKALDETKDEFISMASHQLRTPLTSVKGYLSMVLEGDAGKVGAAQRKLLDQAFVSSQRMVYLIADLLNVSRLRTGKFVIESTPTNLAQVVEGEISQLTETASARNLKLVYKKPKKFPSLMLDETKIRQVIMNFVDNAIYYTPSGGRITVDIKDDAHSVEFTVTDNGIGIPREEQHHLFTKFFRAGNARKARPDGTGLGLFMAKKVIAAQGGSIIFKSQEGKGSTFGFTFAKDKLAVSHSANNATS